MKLINPMMGLLLLAFSVRAEVGATLWSTDGRQMKPFLVEGPSNEQLAALERLKRMSRLEVIIRWNEKNWTVASLSGQLRKIENSTPAAINKKRAQQARLGVAAMKDIGGAELFLEENKALFKISDPRREFILKEHQRDELGMRHIKFEQSYKEIPVWSSQLIVHVNRDNEIYTVSGNYQPTPVQVGFVGQRVTASQAIEIATADLQKTIKIEPIPANINQAMKYKGPSAEKIIFHERSSGAPHLTWMVNIRPNVSANWYYFVGCSDSKIIFKYDASVEG